jgi:hypothetical protein
MKNGVGVFSLFSQVPGKQGANEKQLESYDWLTSHCEL